MSSTGVSPSVDPLLCDRLIRVSCSKMLSARSERGGAKLHKNLLVLHLLRKAREEQRRMEVREASMLICDDEVEEEEEEDECMIPPLEFSVKDDEDGIFDGEDAPLVFATEATECCDSMEDTPLSAPALSSALNDALARLTERKRKPSTPRSQPQKKTCKKPDASVRVAVVCK